MLSLNGIQVKFGLTKKNFKIGSDVSLSVRKINIKRGFTRDPLIERYLEKIFIIGEVTTEFVLINIKNIVSYEMMNLMRFFSTVVQN